MPIITLLTDFGSQDYFVGAMKGAILSINPAASIVDITHEIPPQDIRAAAFNLLAVYQRLSRRHYSCRGCRPGSGIRAQRNHHRMRRAVLCRTRQRIV